MKRYISSHELYNYSLDLAKRISVSEWQPDVVIGLYRGGVFPAIVIEDYLRSNGIKTFHFPLHCQSYDANAAESVSGEVKVVDLPEYALTSVNEWKNILIVDDICDTGKTIEAVKAKIRSYGPTTSDGSSPFNFRSACLIWKPATSKIRPTWWVKEVIQDDWLVFPHEFTGLSENALRDKSNHENNPQLWQS